MSPLPSPTAGESKTEFVGRCMGSDVMNSEYPDTDQRAAVCYSQWGKSAGATAFEDEAKRPDLLFDTADTISFEQPLLLQMLNGEFGTQYTFAEMTQAHPLPIPNDQSKWLKKVKHKKATYENLMPDFRAIDAMKQLNAVGYHITISSNRPAKMDKATKKWLDYWGVPYTGLEINGPDSKESFAKSYGPDNPLILFDDDPEAMLLFPRDGIEVWTQRKPWTPDDFEPKNCWVFESWQDVLARLAPALIPAT